MKTLVLFLFISLPMLGFAQSGVTNCYEAKALVNKPCILTIESLYAQAEGREEYTIVALFEEPTEVTVKQVVCEPQSVKLVVVMQGGKEGYFYVADNQPLNLMVRLAVSADFGGISF